MRWFLINMVLIAGLLPAVAFCQTKVEVITKTITDELVYKPGYSLKVEGQAADITIRSWDQKRINVTMKLIAKGLTKEIAEKELAYHKYVIDELNEQYVIRNYMLLPSSIEKLSTIQEAVIELMIPRSMNIEVLNSLGKIDLANIRGDFTIDNQYGDVVLTNCVGEVAINNTFGELKLTSIVGVLNADLAHTSTDVSGFSGKGFLKTNLGDVVWRTPGQIDRLRIELEKSDLLLTGASFEDYYWQLKTKYGEILTPKPLTGNKITYGKKGSPIIEINSDFGKISIEE